MDFFGDDGWKKFLEKNQHDIAMQQMREVIRVTASGDRDSWQPSTNPFSEVASSIAELFPKLSEQKNVGDFVCKLNPETGVLNFRHFNGIGEGSLGIEPRPWLQATILGSRVFVSDIQVEIHPSAPVSNTWKRMIWASGLLEPHRKGDLVYVLGSGLGTWIGDEDDIVTDIQEIHYYPSRYKGYPESPTQVCRGKVHDSNLFPNTLVDHHTLPGTTVELSLDYDSCVEHVIEQSGIRLLCSQLAVMR